MRKGEDILTKEEYYKKFRNNKFAHYNAMSKRDLKYLSQIKSIKGRTKMSKEQIVNALVEKIIEDDFEESYNCVISGVNYFIKIKEGQEMDNIIKAVRYITAIRDKNYVTLDNFKKEIEANKNSKVHYNTSVYDNRIENCNTALEALEKQIPQKVIKTEKFSQACPICGISTNGHYCSNCGQKLSY